MTPQTQPLEELNREAMRLLIREFGVADTLRFIRQFSPGSGNYTEDRRAWVDSLSMDELSRELKGLESRRPAGT